MSSQSGDTKKCGWLRKQGGVVKTWHRRWFVLNGDYLFYFQKDEDVKPVGVISLHGNKIIQHPNNPEEPDKFLLEIIPGKTMPAKMSPNHETFLLSASSDDERQDWIRAIRKNMFFNKGGAIFGSEIGETMAFERTRSKRKVPYVVETCVSFLIEKGLEVEGIFRLPGRMLLVRDLKDRFDEGEEVNLDKDEVDVHSVASLLKQFFRELPESLIPFDCYQHFMNIAMRYQGTKKVNLKMEEVESLRIGMTSLPSDNYNVLKYLCSFLNLVSQKTSVNKMSVENLARVFGPNIIRHPQMDDNPEVFMLTTADISEQLAYMLINYHEKIFTMEFDDGRKSVNVAVDDLLGMDNIDANELMPPMSQQTNSTYNDLNQIIIDQRADRRARTFHDTTLDDVMAEKLNEENSERNMADEIMKRSTPMFSEDGKPIPPLRKKQIRKKPQLEVNHTQSNDSISSENSENSVEVSLRDHSQYNSGFRNSIRNSINSMNEPNTQVLELQQKLDTKTAEYNNLMVKFENINASKIKADQRVKNLNDERQKLQKHYEDHIENLKSRHKAQMEEMCKKLDSERTSRAEAVQKIMELQKSLQSYQMTYGDISGKLPPLYHNT